MAIERLGASNFDYSVVTTAACDNEKTVIKPIASFWAKKECVDITMLDKVSKFKSQCRL